MPNWKAILSELVGSTEAGIDAVKRRIDDRFGSETLCITTYRGYGTRDQLYLKGRVLETSTIGPSSETDSAWRNLRNMYRRFESDEIPGARLLARYGALEQETFSDEEGYFEIQLTPQNIDTTALWHEVGLTLLEPVSTEQGTIQTKGAVLVPPADAQFGVISDIDDTVLQTDATNLLRMLRATFLRNAHTRLPFPGVAALYRTLQQGADGQFINPLFYVSSSPWNIYDMLEEFLAVHGIPAGPLLLRDWGTSSSGGSLRRHRQHKVGVIKQILDTYPTLPFILIGDSGQEDPEIYTEIVELYPQRILAIYIRSVNRTKERVGAIQALTEKVAADGSALVLADDTLAVARHAAEHGWIDPDELTAVAAAVEADAPGELAEEAPAVELTPNQADAGAVETTLEDTQSEQSPTVVVDDSKRDE